MAINCWLKRTPVETGLVLILVISIPFLVGMLLTYLYLWSTYDGPNRVKHPYIASLVRSTYADSSLEQDYLCSVAIISPSWIITSSRCLDKRQNLDNYIGLSIRVGSNYWSKEGSVHRIKKAIVSNSTDKPFALALIELEDEVPKRSSIKTVALPKSGSSADHGVAEILAWESNYDFPLKFRKKYSPLVSKSFTLFQNAKCLQYTNNETDILCAHMDVESCEFYLGFPVYQRKTLVGVQVGEKYEYFENKNGNVNVAFIYDISKFLSWIEEVTGVKS